MRRLLLAAVVAVLLAAPSFAGGAYNTTVTLKRYEYVNFRVRVLPPSAAATVTDLRTGTSRTRRVSIFRPQDRAHWNHLAFSLYLKKHGRLLVVHVANTGPKRRVRVVVH